MKVAFALSRGLNPNKVFLVSRSALEGRLDPVFYRPSILSFVEKVKHGKYAAQPLSHISHRIVDGPFGTQLKVEDYQEEGVPVIRVSDVRTGKISETKLVRISPEKHRQLLRSRVLPNDVILTKAGAILGYSAVFPKHLHEGNITSHLVTITCKSNVNPHYLKYVFQSGVGQKQIYRWGNKSTRPELNTGEVARLLIPVPDSTTQSNIVKMMDDAYRKRDQKEAEAQLLLDSIDDYLLSELGIQMPKEYVNDLKNRIFVEQKRNIIGNRLDPYYHQMYFESLLNAVLSSKYKTLRFSEVVSFLDSGSRPTGGVSSYESGVLSFGGEHVNNKCEIEVKSPKYIPIEYHQNHLFTKTQMHDILLVKDGATTGKVGILTNKKHADQNINEHLYLIRTKRLNPYYLTYLLNTKIYQQLIKREITGATVTGLTKHSLRKLEIPVPPSSVQDNISEHIQQIKIDVEKLIEDGQRATDNAKEEIDQVLIGEPQ